MTETPQGPTPGSARAWPELVCPACRGPLASDTGGLRCDRCDRPYPIVAGIPDLRLAPDRYLSFEADRAKAMALDAERADFPGTVAAYWARTPEVPAAVAARFAANTNNGLVRAATYLDALGPVGPADIVLDVGCGTGGLVALAASRGATAVGIDTALRWLVPARRLLHGLGVEAMLVAADGATPPFRSGSFSAVTSIEALEHAADQRGFVNGCLAMAERPGGRCLVVTANRFSLAPEPAVRLWGVGWLPRRWAPAYVARRRHTSYDHTRPVSLAELRAFVGLRPDVVIAAAPLPPPPPGSGRLRHGLQTAADRAAGAGASLTPVAPFLGISKR